MAEKKIAYTERDFLGVRNELLRITNTYYPNLIQNANDASIYSVFLDLNAAVSDNLNFQIDRTFQETVLQFAQERSSLYNLARTYGLKIPGNRPSVTVCDISITVPVFGDKEDFRYLGVLRTGSQFRGGGQIFELVDECNFSSPYSVDGVPNRTKIPNFDANGILTNYTITKREVVVNGVTRIFKKEITDADNKPFFKLFLPEKNVIGVTSVIQKDGVGYQTLPTNDEFLSVNNNRWYEVDALAESEVFVEDPSSPPDEAGIKVGKYMYTEDRFITEFTPEGFFFLNFGGGNQTSQDSLDEFASKGIKLNMAKFMDNVSLGNMVKGNTTLFIQYRVGGGQSSNIGAGSINTIGTVNFNVVGPSPQINQAVINSLAVTNVTAAIGGANQMTQEEIRNYISFNFAAQNRSVTITDYISKLRTMPATFGAAAKVGVTEVENKVNLNILSYTPDGKLTSEITQTLKQNISNYLSNYRMLNDYIVVGSAKVIDLAFHLDLLLESSVNQGDIITTVITTISDYFEVSKVEMGQDLNLGQLRGQIMRVPGVLNIIDLKVFNKVGGNYSQSITSQPYVNLGDRQIGLIDDTIYAKPDEILQIKFPQKDIAIRVKK
jgi:hypothetical protein|tara:strand:+ start:560 stop:2380 length:1821 start_codon:yes stop_codon:yes gene_type:complete